MAGTKRAGGRNEESLDYNFPYKGLNRAGNRAQALCLQDSGEHARNQENVWARNSNPLAPTTCSEGITFARAKANLHTREMRLGFGAPMDYQKGDDDKPATPAVTIRRRRKLDNLVASLSLLGILLLLRRVL
jgi:hypothetical protein